MKLPVVSRLAFDLAIASRDQNALIAQHFQAALAAHEEKYEVLLAKYHMLKLQGFSEPAPAPVVVRPAIDPVAQAINEKAGTNRTLRRQMIEQAKADKAAGASDEQIAFRINSGTSADEFIEAGGA